MKNNLGTFFTSDGRKYWWVTLLFIMATVQLLNAQNRHSISGTLNDQESKEPIAFANVALYQKADSVLVGGAMSNENGNFQITLVEDGDYLLKISVLGYETVTRNIDIAEKDNFNSGTILLQKKVFSLDETIVTGDRMKAKSELDKTVYFVNKKMISASNTGTDILKYIPGIQTDLMNNISLDGSENILIFVDGKERDQKYLNRLSAEEIDKVEVIDHPGTKYEAGVTGIIQVITKRNTNVAGVDGHFYADIPTSKSEIYSFPNFNLNFNSEKIGFYTSYSGEFSYFNIHDKTYRIIRNNDFVTEIVLNDYLRQKNWSHRFHFGFDFNPDKMNSFNYYAWYNPFSRELDGTRKTKLTGNENDQTKSLKEDTDINHGLFNSVYFKHNFNKAGSEITFDLSLYNLRAENTTTFTGLNYNEPLGNYINSVKPNLDILSLRIDYSETLNDKLKLNAGTKTKLKSLNDRNSDGFSYDENNFAAYGSLTFEFAKTEMNLGLRGEYAYFGLQKSGKNNVLAVFPGISINRKFPGRNNLLLSYRRSLVWPNIYELNPYISKPDAFSTLQGNPELKPEFLNELSAGYAKRTTKNYFSGQLFYERRENVIGDYTRLIDNGLLETRIDNRGTMHDLGVRFSGNLKLCESVSVNLYLKLFGRFTQPNSLARQYGFHSRKQLVYQSGFSALVSLKKNLTASFIYQSGNSTINFQGKAFSDALYFISLEKTFKNKIKVGFTSGVPLAKTFTYQGSKTTGAGFYNHNSGDIKLSAIPLWLKVSYQFQSGKKANRNERKVETIPDLPKKGF